MMGRQIRLLPCEWPELAQAAGVAPKEGPEDLFARQLEPFKTLRVERQLRFAKAMGRQWRFDFAFPDFMLAAEIEGIVPRRVGRELVVGGRHGSVAGIIEDMDKYNVAALLGWTVLRFPQKHVKPRHAIDMTLRVLAARGWRSDSA
jgi:very-short-patch-repair endonuclease